MGINNRRRRAAKAKQRQQRRAGRPSGRAWRDGSRRDEFQPSGRQRIRDLLELAAVAGVEDLPTWRGAIALLVRSEPASVDREAEVALLMAVRMLWEHGWQPYELVRHGRRRDLRTGRMVAAAVAADHSWRDPASLHSRWAAQLAALDLPPADGTIGWLRVFAGRESLDRQALVTAVVSALSALWDARPIPSIIPPPGAQAVRYFRDADPTIDDPVLVRVRALLAQAESTSFEAEAEAFTAKAQELMARHAIDAALLWASTARDERPITIRLPIDDPYADIKSLLLQCVAERSRCRAVFDDRHGLSTVIGFASDVVATDMLFTSLLVQSQAALRAESARADPGARVRSRAFRSSFLMGFTRRIDQRLAEINAAVEQAAATDGGTSLLPVLASRDDVVQEAVEELFGTLRSQPVRGGADAAGWVRGALAADVAQLSFGDLDTDPGTPSGSKEIRRTA